MRLIQNIFSIPLRLDAPSLASAGTLAQTKIRTIDQKMILIVFSLEDVVDWISDQTCKSFDGIEGHGQAGIKQASAFGCSSTGFEGGQGGFVGVGGAQVNPMADWKI